MIVVKCGGAVERHGGRPRSRRWPRSSRSSSSTAPGRRSRPGDGGRAASTVTFVDGRRVTDEAAIEVVREALLDVNRALCAALGARAVGLSGDEIGLQATQVPELGLVGDPLPSRPQAVLDALAAGLIPVVAPLAEGPLNVNADEAAAALAVGLGAERHPLPHRRSRRAPGRVGARQRSTPTRPTGCSRTARSRAESCPSSTAAVRAAREGVQAEIGATEVVA